jgi:hypothetical protein
VGSLANKYSVTMNKINLDIFDYWRHGLALHSCCKGKPVAVSDESDSQLLNGKPWKIERTGKREALPEASGRAWRSLHEPFLLLLVKG